MPQTIPEFPEFPPGFEAELCVWNALRAQLPEDAVLISGQRITGDTVEAELDLLVLWPGVGNAVIEVKGGQVSLRDGQWHQSGRGGAHRLKRSPLEQARSGMHALLDHLRPRLSEEPDGQRSSRRCPTPVCPRTGTSPTPRATGCSTAPTWTASPDG